MPIILVDIGNVLVDASESITYRHLRRSYNMHKAYAHRFFKNNDYLNFSRGKLTEVEFCKALVENHLMMDLEPEKLRFAHDKHIYGVNTPVLEVIHELHKHHTVAIATNTNDWQTNRIEVQMVEQMGFPPLSTISDYQFRSNEIKMLKEDDGFFPYVLEVLRPKKSEKVYLIDDLIENLQAAEKHGIQGILYEGFANPLETQLETLRLL